MAFLSAVKSERDKAFPLEGYEPWKITPSSSNVSPHFSPKLPCHKAGGCSNKFSEKPAQQHSDRHNLRLRHRILYLSHGNKTLLWFDSKIVFGIGFRCMPGLFPIVSEMSV